MGVWSYLVEAGVVETVARLMAAAVCGGLIGIERGRRNRPAGLRTHMLVCMASALVMLTNQLITAGTGGDPTRMGAQVISGIGFLGAGTILVDRQKQVRGLTTAAGLWASACIGLALGVGYYLGAVTACVLILIIFVSFGKIEQRLIGKARLMEVSVTLSSAEQFQPLLASLSQKGCSIIAFEIVPEKEDAQQGAAVAHLTVSLPLHAHRNAILEELSQADGIRAVEEL